MDTGEVLPSLNHCLAAAHGGGYHAVFGEDVVGRLPFPTTASAELCDLVGDLDTRDFAHLPRDVLGAVFERLIPHRRLPRSGREHRPGSAHRRL